MRMLYLYVQDGLPLQGQELNFTSEYRFRICSETRPAYFECVKGKGLVDGFYTLDGKGRGIELSAVVGSNGSGKTTVGRILHQIISHDSGLGNFAFAAQFSEDQIDFYYEFVFGESGRDWLDGGPVLRLDENGFDSSGSKFNLDFVPQVVAKENVPRIVTHRLRNEDDYEALRKKMVMVYYSPVFSSQHPTYFIEQDYFHDLSTTAALKKAHSELGHDVLPNFGNTADVSDYEVNETIKALETVVLLQEHADELNEVAFPVPLGCFVGRNADAGRIALEYWKSHARDEDVFFQKVLFSARTESGAEVNSAPLPLIRTMVEMTVGRGQLQSNDFVVRAFFLFVWTRWRDVGISKAKEDAGCEGLLHLAAQTFFKVEGSPETTERQETIRTSIVEGLKDIFKKTNESVWESASVVFKILRHAHEMEQGWHYDFTSCTVLSEELKQLIVGHAKSRVKTSYLTFRLSPQLSAGEMSFLSLWGRLKADYDSAGLHKATEPANQLIFMDEVETTLHPDLQRRVVWLLVWFYEKILWNVRPHIVLATHSPILLSDFPLGNCVFLEREKTKEGFRTKVTSILDEARRNDCVDTFAANVFDLYFLSFFMKEGTVGCFAEDKIKKIADRIQDGFSDPERLQKDLEVVSLIGDPFVRNYLLDEMRVRGLLNETNVFDS